MLNSRLLTLVLFEAVLAFGGCGGSKCASISDATGAWSKAARVTVAVYGTGAHCTASGGVTGAAAPIMSRSFAKQAAISIDMAPGHHTIVVTLFVDDAGTVPLATACTERDFAGGSDACLNLTLDTLDPTACSSDGDCASASGDAMGCCANHCVDLTQTNLRSCGNGVCIDAANCCKDADCNAPPAQAGCFQGGSCSGVGGSCSYTLRAGAQTCGTTCCRNVNGTCNADCALTCAFGFADCDGDPSNGCEQSLYDANYCGGCFTQCIYPNAVAACPTGTCMLTRCAAGFQNCDGLTANGCECAGTGCCANGACQDMHNNGIGQTFTDCVAPGTYNQTQATEACAAFTGDASQCHVSTTCSSGVSAVCSDGNPSACNCWVFSGSGGNVAGKVRTNSQGSCDCSVHNSSPGWN
jgi:hypothetical protein